MLVASVFMGFKQGLKGWVKPTVGLLNEEKLSGGANRVVQLY